MLRASSLALLLAFASAPALAQPVSPVPEIAHEQAAQQILDRTDWKQAEVIDVELGDHHYTPATMEFRLHQPYVLRLKNVGGHAHDLKGQAFYRAIVAKMVLGRNGRVVTPFIQSVYVRPKAELELWFVPVAEGDYEFFCTIDGHREEGMEGRIVIR